MNGSYCDEVSENLTTSVTVGNARWERRCKQKITFKDHKKKQIWNWCSFAGYTHSPLFLQSLKLLKVWNTQSG